MFEREGRTYDSYCIYLSEGMLKAKTKVIVVELERRLMRERGNLIKLSGFGD